MLNKKRKSRVPQEPTIKDRLTKFLERHARWDTSKGISLRRNPTPRNERNYDTSPSKPNRYLKTFIRDTNTIEWIKQ